MSGVSAPSAMQRMAAWRWGALLAFALFAPVGLPAGGVDRRSLELRRRSAGEPLILPLALALSGAPCAEAPLLRSLPAGEPLEVLRSWADGVGERWLQVRVAADVFAQKPVKGWLRLS
jgi:hypothetical protein